MKGEEKYISKDTLSRKIQNEGLYLLHSLLILKIIIKSIA